MRDEPIPRISLGLIYKRMVSFSMWRSLTNMRFTYSVLALVLLTTWGQAQSVVLPTEVKAEPGTFTVIRAETDCADLRWVVLDEGLSLIPPELLKDSRAAVVMAGRTGRYRVLAYGALRDVPTAPAICTVVVGNPKPPDPVPPPVPDDPTFKELKAAFVLDGAPKDKVELLAAVYAEGAASLDKLNTVGDVKKVLRSAAMSVLALEDLKNTRTVISNLLMSQLGPDPATVLTDDSRSSHKAYLLKLKSYLEVLSK